MHLLLFLYFCTMKNEKQMNVKKKELLGLLLLLSVMWGSCARSNAPLDVDEALGYALMSRFAAADEGGHKFRFRNDRTNSFFD